MNERVFEGRITEELAPDDRARRERLKAAGRALVGAVREGLLDDGIVRIHGFGTFRLRPVAARDGRHPRTGERIRIPAGWRVMFRPAKALRERVEPERPPSVPLAEPQASREAMLAGGAPATHAEEKADAAPAAPAMSERPRTAAAAMAEPRATALGPVPPTRSELESDTRVTRTPAALTRQSPPSETHARAPAANEPGRDIPGNPPPAGADAPAVDAPHTQTPEPQTATSGPARRELRRVPLAALVLLLLLGMGWWLWPREDVQPVPAASNDSVDEGGAAAESAAVDPAGATAEAPAATETVEAEGTATADTSGAMADADGAGEGSATMAVPEVEPGETALASSAETPATAADSGDSGTSASAAQVDQAADDAPAASGDADAAAEGEGGTAESVGSQQQTASTAAESPAAPENSASATATSGAAAPASGEPWFAARDHTVRAGDTLWGLSDRNYLNPYFWPHIWNSNEAIENPDRLELRDVIRLPALEGRPQALTDNDRRRIAEGYLRLYRFFKAEGAANPQYALVGVRYFDASVLPERLRARGAGRPGDTLAAAFRAQLEAEFPFD